MNWHRASSYSLRSLIIIKRVMIAVMWSRAPSICDTNDIMAPS